MLKKEAEVSAITYKLSSSELTIEAYQLSAHNNLFTLHGNKNGSKWLIV